VSKEQRAPPPESEEVEPVGDISQTQDPTQTPETPETVPGECVLCSMPAAFPIPTAIQAGTTRKVLRHLGWLLEEVVRGSQEKVGLAQAAYDSVRHHI
jgi:hypothetical protein